MAGLGSLKKVDCTNELGAKEGDEVMIKVPDALEGINAVIFFMPIILTIITYMFARTNLDSSYNVYILAGALGLFFLLKFAADKIINLRTRGEFADSKIIKIL